MKAGRQRVMHCPCGNTKVLALGLCATCYTLKRQDENTSVGCVKPSLSATDIAVACVTPQAATNDPSLFITVYREDQCCG